MGAEGRALHAGRLRARSAPGRLGRVLLRRAAITEPDLSAALAAADESGRPLGELVVARGYSTAAQVAEAEAEERGLGFVDLEAEPPDPSLSAAIGDPRPWLDGRILPWRRLGRLTAYATDRPEGAAAALGAIGAAPPMAFVRVATTRQMDAALSAAFAPHLAERAAARVPESRSVRSLGRARGLVGVVGAATAGALLFAGEAALIAGFALVLVVHLLTLALRAAALVAGARPEGPAAAPPAQAEAVRLADRRRLPMVSLLVPLYREAGMVGDVVAVLEALDYPRELIDAKLLVEEDDAGTRAAIGEAALPGWLSVVVVPAGRPRTKPRALNYALDFCRGEIIGIFDAEDRPDPRQLRDVVAHFADAPPETRAVQCQLCFYNAGQNWLARWFQLEYAIWFEVLLQGYRRLGLPLPLGGTSVYLRAPALRSLGGWDAHNVTEDADLGIRLARAGGHCAVLRSVTAEEAACRLLPWIRQRSRWIKGYLLTWLCHMRRPARLWRDLGARGFLGFNIAFLGGALTYLAAPLFWVSLGHWAAAGDGLWARAVPQAVVAPVGASLALGWAVMFAAAAIAMRRRRSLRLLLWAPGLPFYWWLGALAAWKGVAELVLAPFYWDKTEHGIFRPDDPPRHPPTPERARG